MCHPSIGIRPPTRTRNTLNIAQEFPETQLARADGILSLTSLNCMSESAKTQPVSPLRRAATALSQWIDSDYCPDGAEKMRAEPDKVDWVRVMPFVFLHTGCLAAFWVGVSPVAVWTAADLGLDATGAKVQLRRLYVETREARVELIEADSLGEAGTKLADKLREARLV